MENFLFLNFQDVTQWTKGRGKEKRHNGQGTLRDKGQGLWTQWTGDSKNGDAIDEKDATDKGR